MARTVWAGLKAERSLSPVAQQGYEEAASAYGFGQAVRAARLRRGLEQKELGTLMATSQSAIARLEGGGVAPTLNTILRVARALNVSISVGPAGIRTEMEGDPPVASGRRRTALAPGAPR